MIHRYIIEATDEVKGFEEAIERLDREWGIEELEPCEDAISRQVAIDAMIKIEQDDIKQYGCAIPEGFDSSPAIEALNDLPSVTPQPKMGHWIFDDKCKEHGHCSECGYGSIDLIDGKSHRFCQNCGAKMESEDSNADSD